MRKEQKACRKSSVVARGNLKPKTTLIRLLRASDNNRYITEHSESHNHSMLLTTGEKVHWPSHKHIYVYKDLIRQLRENNVNLGKVCNIIGSFFGSVENICGKISRE